MQYKCINKKEWDNTLEQLLLSYTIFASVENEFGLDYELIRPADINRISYNKPKPATSLKTFFLPVRENVTSERSTEKPRIILGIPNCDIEGLSLLDEIYLDEEYNDIFYRKRRENTILISADCIGIEEHCHCLSYNIKPFSTINADLALIYLNGSIILRIITEKGEDFLKKIPTAQSLEDKSIISAIEKEHVATEALLTTSNKGLPDYNMTGKLVTEAKEEIWNKYSARCVSCGACTTICPTCTCFLLIDKPGFEKVKQMDACQYPGFERVAGGEDALFELHNRFKNRYMCKYVWKQEKFKSLACTGCGRCIEACIGKINKNEIFLELENNR
ncbi:MAG: 4Fe-4S dicluster domain-containing protein [Bacteroidota bacterium]